MDVSYYKDLRHNYLIVDHGAIEDNSYQYHMLSSNPIENLLPCSRRNINGNTYLYYDISSRQSLVNLYQERGMGLIQMNALLLSIEKVTAKLRRYLLDDQALVLDPAYLFQDPEKEVYYFLYNPGSGELDKQSDNTFLPLAEFLVAHVDHEQKEAADIAYKLYDMVQSGHYVLPELMKLLEDKTDGGPENNENISPPSDEEDWYDREESAIPTIPNEAARASAENGIKERHPGMGAVWSFIFIILSLCAGGAAAAVRYTFVLSYEEELLSMAVVAVCILMAAGLFLYIIIRKPRTVGNGRADTAIPAEGQETEYRMNDRKGNLGSNNFTDENPYGEQYEKIRQDSSRGSYPENNGKTYGNTVFMGMDTQTEQKLYQINKGKKYHIDLNRLPCTVGKMPGCVDQVLPEESVSRIHARFSREDKGICMTDLNSTNGTYRNGLRLEPNETVVLEPGDEVRLGNMRFCYR